LSKIRKKKQTKPTKSKATVKNLVDLSAEEELIFEQAGPVGLAKASQAAAFAVRGLTLGGEIRDKPKKLEEWLKLYTDLVWAYAGIFAIASTVAQLEPQLFSRNRKTGEETEISSHKVLDVLHKPNPDMTGYQLKESLMVYLETTGNAYWELAYEDTATTVGDKVVKRETEPYEFWPLRPDRVTPVPKETGHGIDHWKYQIKSVGEPKTFRPDQIVKFEYFNPTKDWFGQGGLFAAVNDILQEQQMQTWNLDFFRHGAVPEGIMTTDKMMNRTEMERLGEDIEKYLKGEGRTVLILSKNMKWETISVNPKDIDFLAGRKENRQAILAALGVPPVKVGLLEHAKYDNYRLQCEAFYRDTIVPKLRIVESCLNSFLLPRFPDLVGTDEMEFLIRFDTTELLKEDEDSLVKRYGYMIEHGLLTPDEGRQKLDLDEWPKEQPGGDKFYMLSTLVEVGAVVPEDEDDLTGREEETGAKIDQMEGNLQKRLDEIREELKEELMKEVEDAAEPS